MHVPFTWMREVPFLKKIGIYKTHICISLKMPNKNYCGTCIYS